MNVQKVRDKLAQVIDQVRALDAVWCDDEQRRSSTPAALQVALEMVDALIERAPFHVGQRVALARTPEIGEDSTWRVYRHFLVQGAKGTVQSVDFHAGKFAFFYVTFDDESWVDPDGGVHPRDPACPAHFCFGEGDLQRLGI